jgi:hypothetical protein
MVLVIGIEEAVQKLHSCSVCGGSSSSGVEVCTSCIEGFSGTNFRLKFGLPVGTDRRSTGGLWGSGMDVRDFKRLAGGVL